MKNIIQLQQKEGFLLSVKYDYDLESQNMSTHKKEFLACFYLLFYLSHIIITKNNG